MKHVLDILSVIENTSQYAGQPGASNTYINLLVRDVATGQVASWQTGEAALQPLKAFVGHRVTAEGEITAATELDPATGQNKPILKKNGAQAHNFSHVRGSTVSYVSEIPASKMASFPTIPAPAPAAAAA